TGGDRHRLHRLTKVTAVTWPPSRRRGGTARMCYNLVLALLASGRSSQTKALFCVVRNSILSCQAGGIMKQRISVFWSTCLVAFFAAWVPPGHAQPAVAGPAYSPPFTETLSNHVPLAFGMDPMTVANALGV